MFSNGTACIKKALLFLFTTSALKNNINEIYKTLHV